MKAVLKLQMVNYIKRKIFNWKEGEIRSRNSDNCSLKEGFLLAECGRSF